METDKDGHPPQRSGELILGIISETVALCLSGVTGYWRWATSRPGWVAGLLTLLPFLLIIYAAVSFSGLVRA